MDSPTLLLLAADLILLLHVLFVAFVIISLALIIIGHFLHWHWIRNPWFRLAHIAAIVFVVLQAWAGKLCPLTMLEMSLRSQAGDTVYSGTFISHWLQKILYYQFEPIVFTVAYTLFGIAVAACWHWIRPRRFNRK